MQLFRFSLELFVLIYIFIVWFRTLMSDDKCGDILFEVHSTVTDFARFLG
jgi:hypothetical protein